MSLENEKLKYFIQMLKWNILTFQREKKMSALLGKYNPVNCILHLIKMNNRD